MDEPENRTGLGGGVVRSGLTWIKRVGCTYVCVRALCLECECVWVGVFSMTRCYPIIHRISTYFLLI